MWDGCGGSMPKRGQEIVCNRVSHRCLLRRLRQERSRGHQMVPREPSDIARIGMLGAKRELLAVWLLIKRSLGAHPRYWYYLSNAPLSVPLRLLVWLSGVRWAIEQCIEETKTELGMDHYEVRKYPGWHHHMLTCLLAHFF